MADLFLIVALLASLTLLGVPLFRIGKKLVRITILGAGVLLAFSVFMIFYDAF